MCGGELCASNTRTRTHLTVPSRLQEEEAKRAAKAAKKKDNPLSKESRKAKKEAMKRRTRRTNRGPGQSPKNKK